MKRFLYYAFVFALSFFLLKSADALEFFSVTGQIIPGEEIDQKGGNSNSPLAWLLVRGEFPGRHIYSLTQPRVTGGYPTEISFSFSDEEGEKIFSIGSFIPASPIEQVRFLGETLEEWNDHVEFLAPISLQPGADIGELSAENIVRQFLSFSPEGKIDGLCCDDNNCVPVKESFSFVQGEMNDEILSLIETVCTEWEEGDSSVLSEPENLSMLIPAESEIQSEGEEEPALSEIADGRSFLLRNLFYAFFGGMILNVMPCVLPVIGLKIVSFFEQAGKSRSLALGLNICYSLGILTVFTVLALMSVGLSYLFTYGAFQIVMGVIVFAMALNLMGVWEITLPGFIGGKTSNKLANRKGFLGSWAKGVITTLLAIPCGAPLLSPALVWTDALMKNGSIWSVLCIYWLIGLGMAAPFLLLGGFPELLKFLPKPGNWMETFKNLMGFVLLAAVIWILYSMPLPMLLPMTALLFAVWFACWYIGKDQFDGDRKPIRVWGTALAVFCLAAVFSFELPVKGGSPLPNLERAFRGKLVKWGVRAVRNGELTQEEWILFDQDKFESALASGKTVMIDFTADWCMNCKVLEAAVLHSAEVSDLIAEKGFLTMTGDWTNRDDSPESRVVGELLRRYGGEQVPVLMIFTPERPENPIVLRGIFTKAELTARLNALE